MFKKTITAAIAALTLTSATFTTTQSAQAEGLGKLVAIGVVGAAVGAIAGAVSSRSSDNEARGYRSQGRFEDRGEYRGNGYRQVSSGYVRSGYDEGCGFKIRPVFDEFGNKVGVRKVPAC